MALDFSTQEACFALGDIDSGNIILSASKIFTGREASSLLAWIISEFDNCEYSINDIKYWTYGIGPGSFTGLRIAASIVAGLTFHKQNIFVRGIPSVNAIFDAMPEDDENKAVLFDGRRKEVFCFKSCDQQLPILIPQNERDNFFDLYKSVYAFSLHKDGIIKFFGEELSENIVFLDTMPIEKLLFNKKHKYEELLESNRFFQQELIYLRPPV